MNENTEADNSDKEMPPGEGYGAEDIQVLQDMAAVRKRPAMYIGDTDVRGLHHLVEEIVANSIDEAMAGFCENIDVIINVDGSVSVKDDGRGIPVDTHEEAGTSALELIMTVLHAGGKFDHNAYKVSGGLHGVGVSVVNALSEWTEAEVFAKGHVYRQEYERGVPKSSLERIGTTNSRGTKITFMPDPEIFGNTTFNYELVYGRLRELAFLNSGVRINFTDQRVGKGETFHYEGGIIAFVEHLNEGKEVISDEVIYIRKEQDDVEVEVALQYNQTYTETVLSFANNVHTHGGGTHLSGFRSALTRTLNTYARNNNLIKDVTPSGEDMREGLTAVVSVKVPDPQFEGQTKDKLGNREVQGIIEAVVNEQLAIYLEEHPRPAKAFISKIISAASARNAARKARTLARRSSSLSTAGLPAKLADCSSNDVDTTEIFIVEGESAGGNAKQCRDSSFQAILPLRGKILNVEKHRLDRALTNNEINILVTTLGTGIGTEDFDVSKLRYNKIIIMTDADVDGLHIRTLLLTFLFRHMKDLIVEGHVYVAQPPLFRVARKKKEDYYLDDKALEKALSELGLDGSALCRTGSDAAEAITGEELQTLSRSIQRLEDATALLGRRGVDFRDFIQLRNEDGSLPTHRVTIDGTRRYLYGEEELSKCLHEAEEQRGGELDLDDPDSGVEIEHWHEAKVISKCIRNIEAVGFSMDEYFPKEDPEEAAPFQIQYDGGSMDILGLCEVPAGIRGIGEKGLDIQRYKGLGEMNADQLGDTTMSPDTRRLLRVRLEDALEADRIFTLLMGSNVAPRREYIEQHALDATNIDLHM